MILLLVAAVGNAITTGTTNLGARMFGMYLVSGFVYRKRKHSEKETDF